MWKSVWRASAMERSAVRMRDVSGASATRSVHAPLIKDASGRSAAVPPPQSEVCLHTQTMPIQKQMSTPKLRATSSRRARCTSSYDSPNHSSSAGMSPSSNAAEPRVVHVPRPRQCLPEAERARGQDLLKHPTAPPQCRPRPRPGSTETSGGAPTKRGGRQQRR